jgi:hypothetical protein
MSCPTHIHETKSGKALCAGCYAERRAKKEAVKAEVVHRHTQHHRDAVETSFQTLEAAPEAEGAVSDEALIASASRIVEPWKMSLYIALAGIGLGILLLIFPTLQHVAFGAWTFSTGFLLLMFIFFSGFWAWIGLRNDDYYKDRIKCFYGIGASVACVVLALVTISSTPTVQTAPVITTVPVRTGNESADQLQEWRDKALNKYKQAQ